MPETNVAIAAPAQPALPDSMDAPGLAAFLRDRQAAKAIAEPESTPADKPAVPEETPAEVVVEQTPEPTPETPEETEALAEGEVETDEQPEGATEPDWVKTRISKISAQKNEWKSKAESAETRITELEARITELSAQGTVPAPSANDPLGFITSEKALHEFSTNVEAQVELMDDFLDGIDLNPAQAEKLKTLAQSLNALDDNGDVSVPKLKRVRRETSKVIERNVPAKRTYFVEEAKMSAKTIAENPWWKQPNSLEYRISQEALSLMPEIKRIAGWRQLLTYFVIGAKPAYTKTAAPAAVAKPKPVPAKVVTAPIGSTTQRNPPVKSAVPAALEAYNNQPNISNLAAVLAARKQPQLTH